MEEQLLDILESLQESRNETICQVLRYIPLRSRHSVITRYMDNEVMVLNLMSRIFQNHIRNDLATAVLTITLPQNGDTFNDAVPIIPTQEQIDLSVESIAATNTNCAICQDSISDDACRIRTCGHSYHRSCINDWFAMNARCPVCRYDIREDQPAQTQPASE